MAYEQRDGQGSLFPNEKKQSEKAPDFKGKVKMNGKMYDISAWSRVGKSGQEYLSLQIADEWVPGSAPASPRSNYASNPSSLSEDSMSDAIPF